MTRRSFPSRASCWTKKFHCPESDRTSAQRWKTGGQGRQGRGVSQQTTRTQKPRSFGERTRDETLETRRKSAVHGSQGNEERERMVPLPAAETPADGGSWLKRQYRRKLIIGVRCAREENKIQASSDCCFQLNPSCATLSTWMNVLAENNQAPAWSYYLAFAYPPPFLLFFRLRVSELLPGLFQVSSSDRVNLRENPYRILTNARAEAL